MKLQFKAIETQPLQNSSFENKNDIVSKTQSPRYGTYT